MSEVELVALIRGCNAEIATLLTDVITINFAMIVAIFYFLNRARLPMKLFAFLVYCVGMTVFLGLLLFESNVRIGALDALRALDGTTLARPTLHLLAVSDSWIASLTHFVMNGAYWLLWLGVAFLLFIWERQAEAPAATAEDAQ